MENFKNNGIFITCVIKANNDIRYSADGLNIDLSIPGFKINDGRVVPIIYNFNSTDPRYCLGFATLKVKEDGVYAECQFDSSVYANIVRDAIKDGVLIYSSCGFSLIHIRSDSRQTVSGKISHVNLVTENALKERSLPLDETSIVKI